ncbi:hypothetical protein Glove_346g69 [Diversispora epigaea]|uniref:GSKIP domain-containing protein n=1 Tax=Diversispora epigaea TaxID=1348612 RepID=A0A397HI29_9GLOM|nr:hypothetical protein Glove_346g69 [Diversispora epigaea]
MTDKFISREITNILKEYEYGIKPNSIKILSSKDGSKFQIELLENIQLTIIITEIGFIIIDIYPNNDIEIEKWINKPFETMDALLINTSPKFSEKFNQALFDKLLLLQQQQQSEQEQE